MHLDHSVADLAGKVYLSESRLQHVFKSTIGISPKKYQIKARLEKAGELLSHSNESISEIARTLSYEDLAYFNRLFKQQWGAPRLNFALGQKKSNNYNSFL